MRSVGAILLLLLLAPFVFGQQEESSDLSSLLAAAQQAQAANNYAAAANDYAQAVKLRPHLAELRANLGLMQYQAGKYSEASQSFRQALKINPSLYVPTLFLGVDSVRGGKPAAAISLLLKAERMHATDPLPPLTLGRAYASLGEYGSAIQKFRRTLELDPKQSSAWFNLGLAQLATVEDDARIMTSTYAASSYAKALFGESLTDQSRYKEAASLYKEVVASPDQPPCMLSEAGFVSLKQGDTQLAASQFAGERHQHPECSLALLGEARLRIDSGADLEALQLIQQVWTRDQGFLATTLPRLFDGVAPRNLQDFLNLVHQQQLTGNVSRDLYVVLIQPRAADARSAAPLAASKRKVQNAAQQGRQQYMQGHYAQCASLLENSLRSRDTAVLQMLAACSFFTGNYTVAADAGLALASLSSPPAADALYWSIQANEKLASASLAHFQQLEPNSARSHILLGDMYRQRERYDDARNEYAKALAVAPDNPAALLGMAFACYDEADFNRTIALGQQALLQRPDDPEINLLMGEALASEHKFSQAEPFLLKSLSAKPQMLPHVHAVLGESYAATGKTEAAIRELKLGASSDQDGTLHYQLARMYNKLGDHADAAAALRQMQAIKQRHRANAVIAIQDAHASPTNREP